MLKNTFCHRCYLILHLKLNSMQTTTCTAEIHTRGQICLQDNLNVFYSFLSFATPVWWPVWCSSITLLGLLSTPNMQLDCESKSNRLSKFSQSSRSLLLSQNWLATCAASPSPSLSSAMQECQKPNTSQILELIVLA